MAVTTGMTVVKIISYTHSSGHESDHKNDYESSKKSRDVYISSPVGHCPVKEVVKQMHSVSTQRRTLRQEHDIALFCRFK